MLTALDLPTTSNEKQYSPHNLWDNEYFFSNDAIESAIDNDEILLTKNDWLDFMDQVDQLSDEADAERDTDTDENETEDDDETYEDEFIESLEDSITNTVDYANRPQINYQGYEETMEDFNQDIDDFYGILPDAMDYEDPLDFTDDTDNGRDISPREMNLAFSLPSV